LPDVAADNSVDSTDGGGAATRRSLRWLALSLLVVLLDQATKLWAVAALRLYESLPVLPSFNLTLLYNRGAAFSFLSNAGGWQRWVLSALAALVSVWLVLWLRGLPAAQRWTAAAVSLVLGGALGNLVDRVVHGYVIDFIDVYYRQWHWPAFNVADSAITVGVVLLLVEMFRGR